MARYKQLRERLHTAATVNGVPVIYTMAETVDIAFNALDMSLKGGGAVKLRAPRRGGHGGKPVMIDGQTRTLSGWARVLGVSREYARQLHDAGKLESRVLQAGLQGR